MSSAMVAACPEFLEKASPSGPHLDWQEQFLKMLPAIRRQLRFAFLHLTPDDREEAEQEAVANCLVAYRRLVQQDRESAASATSLATYAIAQVRTGRGIGGPLNVNDVTSRYCRWKTGTIVESLDRVDPRTGEWQEALMEDRRASPAELAAARIDLNAWLDSLSPKMRAVAETLATGEATSSAARLFNVTAGRISQLRRLLQEAWEQFQGEDIEPSRPAFA